MDPRYSATYGNPYLLRTSNTSLPPPHSNHSPTSGAHPLAHSISGHQNHLSNHHHHQPSITANGGLGGMSGSGSGSGSPLIPGSTSPLSHSQGNTLNNSTNPYGMRNGGGPMVPSHTLGSTRTPSTPSPQYIVPSQPQLKPGTLATHV